jgi:hypothetical protein
MTFLGFTNAVAGAPATNALFGFNRIPSEDTGWESCEVSRWDGTNWIAVKISSGNSFSWFQPGGATNFHGGPTDYFLRGTVPVVDVTAPTRVVLRLTRDRKGFWQKVAGYLGPIARILKVDPASSVAGPADRYFMTNEFNFGPVAEPR